MAVTNYYRIGGDVVAEESSGVRREYVSDGMGSVVAVESATGSVVIALRYGPFGKLLSKSGAGADPKFGWAGAPYTGVLGSNQSLWLLRRGPYGPANGSFVSPYMASDVQTQYGLGNVGKLGAPPVCGSSLMPWKSMIPKRVDVDPSDKASVSYCGATKFRTVWKVPNQDTNKYGAIIQFVTFNFNFQDCQGNQISPPNGKAKGKYLEAWSYTPNGHVPFIDTFWIYYRQLNQVDCQCGTFDMDGLVSYYEDCTVPGLNQPPNPPWGANNGWSGALPTIDVTAGGLPPNLKIGPRGKFLHYASNCCVGFKDNTTPYWGEGGTLWEGKVDSKSGACYPPAGGKLSNCASWKDAKPKKVCNCASSPCPLKFP